MSKIIEKFGIYFLEIGLNKTYGRLFGIFMTELEPLSMGQLVEKLKISKSTVSTELRRLIVMGVIEKISITGERSDFYRLKSDIWQIHLAQKIQDIKKLRTILDELPDESPHKSTALKDMEDYCIFMEEELEQLIKKYTDTKKLNIRTSGCFIEQAKEKKFIIEWFLLPALSEEFTNKMNSVSDLGIESFRDVEIEFLSHYPQALEEDSSLFSLQGLNRIDLETALNTRLCNIFTKPYSDLSDQLLTLMADAYYYFVTIKEKSSNKTLGFITFLSGGPVAKDSYKITVLAVDKTVRREGLAGFLVNALKKIGIKYNKIFVSTRPTNSVAINAYKKWGFIEDPEAENSDHAFFIKKHWVHLVINGI